jgi:alpha-D-ribose 1-methylphosphonate 5-phosphate C-P lyase
MTSRLKTLVDDQQEYSYAFLDAFAKRELRRRILKAIAVPGCQMPYASRELPIARGWGTGGLQVTLSVVAPQSVVKVIDQGADDSVNAANLRSFIAKMTACQTTTDATQATIIQSRHRIPEERLHEGQLLVLQVPDPEPLRRVEPNMAKARELHADAEYGQMWLVLYEQLVRFKRYMGGASYPALVHGRYVISPSPIPRWDNPKLHQSEHLTLLSAGREKRLYAVPPYTEVQSLEFSDVPFEVEDQRAWRCAKTGARHKFMNELPQADGGAKHEISDTDFADKLVAKANGEAVQIGATYYDEQGNFYHDGYLKQPRPPA